MNKNTVTPLEESALFDKGLVIRRAWIRPPGQWEYYVHKAGELKNCIATRSTHRAAYNAALRWLETHPNPAVTVQPLAQAEKGN